MIDFSSVRRTFDQNSNPISIGNLPENPLTLAQEWLADAYRKKILDGNAMSLATASKKGVVTSRTVLLKYLDERGFIFFTNYQSQKAKDLAENPHAAVTFYWPSLNKQMIAQGSVEKLPLEDSKSYYYSRPRLNQLYAHVSNQDEFIHSIEEIQNKAQQLDKKYENKPLPYPLHWGGFILKPDQIEFWQGGAGRLNIRYRYFKANNGWSLHQLSP